MELLHGTSSIRSSLIKEEGLFPRKGVGNWFRDFQHPSLAGFVYLTNKNALSDFHALRTALIDDTNCSIITVDVEESKLFPDENFFSYSTDLLYKEDMEI